MALIAEGPVSKYFESVNGLASLSECNPGRAVDTISKSWRYFCGVPQEIKHCCPAYSLDLLLEC